MGYGAAWGQWEIDANTSLAFQGSENTRDEIVRRLKEIDTEKRAKRSGNFSQKLIELDQYLRSLPVVTGQRSKTKLTREQHNAQKLASKRWSLIEGLLVEIDGIVTSNVSRTSLNKTRLKQVGFTEEFINEMGPAVLNHFVNADAYMAKGMWEKGQEELDKITEPELANKKANRFKHPTIWSGEAIWISRNQQDYLVASRMLLAYHIGKHKGTYGRVVRGESSEDELGRAGESVVYAPDVSQDLTFDKLRSEENRERADAKVGAHGLTLEEVLAIQIYTIPSVRLDTKMNNALWDWRIVKEKGAKKEASKNEYKDEALWAALAQRGLKKMPRDGGITYRGDQEFGGLANTCRVGTVITMSTLWSSSKLQRKAFGGAVGWIIKNSPGRYIGDISTCAGEEEVLIPVGEKLRVAKIYTRAGADPGDALRFERRYLRENWVEKAADGHTRALDIHLPDDRLVFSFLANCKEDAGDKGVDRWIKREIIIVAEGL